MMNKYPSPLLVFGAGCIGRGFLGELATREERPLIFINADPEKTQRLRRAGQYKVRRVGRKETTTLVTGYEVLNIADEKGISGALGRCGMIATAVGGDNLVGVAAVLGPLLKEPNRRLAVLLCENMRGADRYLRDALIAAGADPEAFFCEVISVEPMFIPAHDSLDIMGEAIETGLIERRSVERLDNPLAGLQIVQSLEPYYARKLFTNNAGHALLAYEGYLTGKTLLCDAMDKPEIRRRLEDMLKVSVEMLHREYALGREELREHTANLMRWRFPNRDLADTIRRVARDPLRKLGPDERLVGLLRRLIKHELPIGPVCDTIAAALHYQDPANAEARRMHRQIDSEGPGTILEEYCGILPEEKAFPRILDARARIRERR
ncbi:MAG: hypothetical protein ACOC29_00720 [Candidatus Sumerlaeota bacterium]